MKVTKQDLMELGFKEVENYTVTDNLTYDLGRERYLSIGSIGTPNEIMFLCQKDTPTTIEDLVCVHNYDFDGFLTIERVKYLIYGIMSKIVVKNAETTISASEEEMSTPNSKKRKTTTIRRTDLLPGRKIQKCSDKSIRTIKFYSKNEYFFIELGNSSGFTFSWIKQNFKLVD